MERKDMIKKYIERVSRGEELEIVRADFRRDFAGVPADEIADAEKLLMEEGMQLSEVQQLCDVHAALFEGAVQTGGADEPAGHPLYIFSKENEGLARLLDSRLAPAYAAWQQDAQAGQQALAESLRALRKIDLHYSRKENLFFPYLEKAGVTAPPKVMWGVDDEIRELIKQTMAAVEAGDIAQAGAMYPRMLEQVRNMITKEEEILKPLLRKHLNEDAWRTVARESSQIGYAFAQDIEGASPSDAASWAQHGHAEPTPRGHASVQLPSGYFEINELTAVLNTLPCDMTFVAADDTVHFFSEQKNRIFPRTRTIIGRQVADCHPPKSLHAVEALVEAFKQGRKDSESYWIQRGGKFILIRYYAVRDTDGTYLGVLECTEEISELRTLEGDKTLMS